VVWFSYVPLNIPTPHSSRSIRLGDPWSTQLMAQFHLVPSTPDPAWTAVNVTSYLGRSTGPRMFRFDEGDPLLPLPYPAVGCTQKDQNVTVQPWESRIPGSPRSSLARRVFRPTLALEHPLVVTEDDGEDEGEDEADDGPAESWENLWFERRYKNSWMVVATRSMVSVVDRSPIYSLPKFKRKMRALKQREVCACNHL
jgi:hypothetical protein